MMKLNVAGREIPRGKSPSRRPAKIRPRLFAPPESTAPLKIPTRAAFAEIYKFPIPRWPDRKFRKSNRRPSTRRRKRRRTGCRTERGILSAGHSDAGSGIRKSSFRLSHNPPSALFPKSNFSFASDRGQMALASFRTKDSRKPKPASSEDIRLSILTLDLPPPELLYFRD